MLSNIIFRSTAAFGGAPFRLKKCTSLSSAAGGAASGAAVGGVPGALVGGALGVASSLLGGPFGKHNTNKINQMNYQIMQEQNRFNAEESQKNRDWQELMYRMFGTSSAKANDMRAAGLNALLGDVSASGSVGSGAAGTAAESADMLPADYSQLGTYLNIAPSTPVSRIDMAVTYGYAPRYAELKSARDYFEGGFCGTFKTWVTGYDESFLALWRTNRGRLSVADYGSIDDLFKCRPSLLYPIFVNQWSGTVNDDKLLIGSVNTCVAVRPFSMYGLPYSK